MSLVDYRRSGGRTPADDERIEIADDGTFAARRTVGGRAIGDFAGQLPDDEIDALRAEVATAAEAGDLAVATPPDGATEMIAAAGRTAQLGSNEQPGGTWGPLVERLRRLVADAVATSPRAALQLEAASRQGRLVHAGADPIEVDVASIGVRLVRLDKDGAVLGRWNAPAAGGLEDDDGPAPADWQTAGPGWSHALPFDHPLELAPGDWLQVWVTLTVRSDGLRDGRLFASVSG